MPRGGKRERAGRPLKMDAPLLPWEIRLPAWAIQVIRQHGTPDGVRQAVITYACSVVPTADDDPPEAE